MAVDFVGSLSSKSSEKVLPKEMAPVINEATENLKLVFAAVQSLGVHASEIGASQVR